MAFDSFFLGATEKRELSEQSEDLFNNLPTPEPGWARENPDAALALIYVTHQDNGMLYELLSA